MGAKVKKDVNIILGERIRERRNALNLTRERLAEKINVSARFLADVEAGKVGVSLQTLKNLSESLEASADFLVGLEYEPSRNYILALFRKLEALDEKYYPALLNLTEELIRLN